MSKLISGLQITTNSMLSTTGNALTLPTATSTLISLDNSVTITGKTFTSPQITAPIVTLNNSATVNITGGGPINLDSNSTKYRLRLVTATAPTIVYPTRTLNDGVIYEVYNISGQIVTFSKTSGGGGIAIANNKTAIVRFDTTADQFVRVTADS